MITVEEQYRVVFENNLDHRTYEVSMTECYTQGNYVRGKVALKRNMPDGEYTLSLYRGIKLISKSLARIGNYNADRTQYAKETKKYVQYNKG